MTLLKVNLIGFFILIIRRMRAHVPKILSEVQRALDEARALKVKSFKLVKVFI